MHDEPTGGYPRTMVFILSYKRNFLISMLNLVMLALLTVNLPKRDMVWLSLSP